MKRQEIKREEMNHEDKQRETEAPGQEELPRKKYKGTEQTLGTVVSDIPDWWYTDSLYPAPDIASQLQCPCKYGGYLGTVKHYLTYNKEN